MANLETVRTMTDGQRSDIIATMVSAMPSLSFDQAQRIIGAKGPFVADIKAVFRRRAPAAQLPTDFTISGRTYELVPFLKEGEGSVRGNTMVERARELNANLGEDDGAFILEHQDEIPQEFQGKIYLVFTAWRDPSDVAYLNWCGDRWHQSWRWRDGNWNEFDRLVRRVS